MSLVDIGFQHGPAADRDLRARLSPSLLNRALLVDRTLRNDGLRLLLYSPIQVDTAQATVQGCVIEDGEFVAIDAPVPRANGNWTYRTRRLLDAGVGYREFSRWITHHGIGVYVPYAFSDLISNKLEAYKLVRVFHETLHPHCESYMHERRQLAYFVETNRLTFIKPRRGNRGERIITIRREPDGLVVTRHAKRKRRSSPAKNLEEVMTLVSEVTRGSRTYVIQHGVDIMLYEGSTFDVRVTMLNDGEAWHFLHETRLSRRGSDVSNISQGGMILTTEDLLFRACGAERAQELLRKLESESRGLAAYLEQLHPGDIHEVAFDFAIDTSGELRLLEINTKPGLAGLGSEIRLEDKRPEHEAWFERWVYPHTKHLARFLRTKALANVR